MSPKTLTKDVTCSLLYSNYSGSRGLPAHFEPWAHCREVKKATKARYFKFIGLDVFFVGWRRQKYFDVCSALGSAVYF